MASIWYRKTTINLIKYQYLNYVHIGSNNSKIIIPFQQHVKYFSLDRAMGHLLSESMKGSNNKEQRRNKEDIDKTPLGKLSAKVDAHMKDLNEFYNRINTDEDVKKYTKMREHAISLRKDVVLTREAMGWRGDHHQLVSETWPLPPKKNVK